MADEVSTSEPFSGTDPTLDDEGEEKVRWLLQSSSMLPSDAAFYLPHPLLCC